MWPAMGQAAARPPDDFRAAGAAALGPVLDGRQLAAVRAASADILPRHGVVGPYATIVHDAWRRAPVLVDLLPHLGAIACAVTGFPELVLFHDHVLRKQPGGDDMAWHQDFSYLPLDRADGLTLWIALDEVTEANGCLYYLPGSHRLGERRPAWGIHAADDPRAGLPPVDVPPAEPGIAAPTAAGCAIAHHALVLHRSPRNRTARARFTWVLSFVVPEARWAPRRPHPRSAVSPRTDGQPLEPDLPRVRARP